MRGNRWLRLAATLVTGAMAVQAQITLATLVGTVQTPVTSYYNYPSLAANATLDVTFVATNTGTAQTSITKLALSGIGFAIVNSSTLPIPIDAGKSATFFVRFTGGPVGIYFANLQVNSTVIGLQETVVQAATLSVASPCTGPDSTGAISFGRIPQTQTETCTFTISNPYTQALSVSPITLTGAAFKTAQANSASIPAGQTNSFTVVFTAATATAYAGSLTIGVRTYSLSGTGYLSPLPAPILSFNGTSLRSGNQYILSANLPSPAPSAATGTISLTFTPASSSLKDDSAVQFVASGSRSAAFSVDQGSTALRFDNQAALGFSTGTTAGTITFQVDDGTLGISGNTVTSWTVAPTPISIDTASATIGTAGITLTLAGFDNTYSVGAMNFTFYDTNGKQIGTTINADFTEQFQLFYQNQSRGGISTGSAFLVALTFPVSGNEATIGSMTAQLTNSTGVTTVSSIAIP